MSKTLSPSEKAARDNRANQLNQEHRAYWQSRGLPMPTTPTTPSTPPSPPETPKQG
jgi:hypothetical protein